MIFEKRNIMKISIVITVLIFLIIPVNACTYSNGFDFDGGFDSIETEPCTEYYYYLNTYHPNLAYCEVDVDLCNPHNLIDERDECFGAFGA